MKQKTIEIKLDFRGLPFIVEACDTDGSHTRLSTKDFLIEEIMNVGLEDTLYGQEFRDGIYEVHIEGSCDYEHTDYDYEIIYTRISDDA